MAIQKRFRATLQTDDESAFTYIVVPFDTKAVFGKGRPPVLRMVRYGEEMMRPLLDGVPRGPAAEATCGWP